MLFSAQTFDSLAAIQAAFILQSGGVHSDTTLEGREVFGWLNGEAVFCKEEHCPISGELFIVPDL